ncbi:hypothetical protein V1525DRAFT_385184 [Lipomyces kononenkoae]|uniref:Uncharacterized protein n=1 Tax=Lipomyces kononenkoae TaxID=34357 RepID=A0ACC3TAC1_LIPKO
MERLAEMQQQMQEQMLQQQAFDQMEGGFRGETGAKRRTKRATTDAERTPGSLLSESYPYNSTSSYPLQNNAAGSQNTASSATPQHRYSSPINEAEDDADILALFFNWKISNTRNDERRIKWQQARDLVLQNDWSMRDLQQMVNGMSAMYQRAIQAGISDGFAWFQDTAQSL